MTEGTSKYYVSLVRRDFCQETGIRSTISCAQTREERKNSKKKKQKHHLKTSNLKPKHGKNVPPTQSFIITYLNTAFKLGKKERKTLHEY
jgi:hypothetical protein